MSKMFRMKRKLELDTQDCCLPYTYDLCSPPLFISNSTQLTQFAILFEHTIVMAIDTETKPTRRSKTSLLQICCRTHTYEEYCFIIDLQSLSLNTLLLIQLNTILSTKILNDSCTIVGHSIKNDFLEICRSFPILTAFEHTTTTLDTNLLFKSIHPESADVSLKFLTKKFLHFNLIKTQTRTDWSVRPLSSSQLYYAACDVTVLLRLFDEMMCFIKECSTNVVGSIPCSSTKSNHSDNGNSGNSNSSSSSGSISCSEGEGSDSVADGEEVLADTC